MAINVPVKDVRGKQVANLGLNEAVFGVEMNETVVYEALVRQRANERQGTASSKTRGEVSGTTRKPWRQKHTGRARVGTRMSPLWRHGGTVFGPKPRSFRKGMPRKARRLAIRCLLSDKQRGSELAVVKELNLEGKTKELVAMFDALDIGHAGVLIVTKELEPAVMRGARNLDRVKAIPAALLSAGDLLRYQFLVMTVDAVRAAERIWANKKINRGRLPGAPVEDEVTTEELEEVLEAETAIIETEPTAPVDGAIEDEAPKPRRRRETAIAGTRSRSARAKSERATGEKKPVAAKKPAKKAGSKDEAGS